jgi:hypothetical protein
MLHFVEQIYPYLKMRSILHAGLAYFGTLLYLHIKSAWSTSEDGDSVEKEGQMIIRCCLALPSPQFRVSGYVEQGIINI